MEQTWRDRIAAFERFNRWEAERLRQRQTDFARLLEWLSDAWELADRIGAPDPNQSERRIQELLALRRALGQARIGP